MSSNRDVSTAAAASSPDMDGELARLIRHFDWARTSLGPIAAWPDAVRTIVAFILKSPTPLVTLWGDAGVMIYNDAYAVFAGERHPALLGSNVREGWSEIADFNDHVLQVVLHGGQTLSYKDQELSLDRDGGVKQLWMDLDYSPVCDEAGVPIGVVAIVLETTEKVLADRQIQDQRRRLQQMAEQSPSFMALLEGPEHRIAMFNPNYAKLVGHRDLLGKTIAEALPDAVEQGYLTLLDNVFRSGTAFVLDGAKYNVQSEPGGAIVERYVDFVYQPITDAHGAVTGIFVDGIDITDRVKARAAIDASAAQFRLLAQSLPNHIWTARADGMLDWFNDRMVDYTGIAQTQLAGTGWAAIIHPEDRAAAVERWHDAVATGDVYDIELRLCGANGAYRWHLVRAKAIPGEDGAPRWVGTNTDIQDQKLSLAQSERDRDRLWALSRDIMLVCDFTGLITDVNPSVTRLLGWEQEEMVGHTLIEFLHPDDVAASTAEVAKLSHGMTTLAFENRYRTKAGGYCLLAWTAVPEAGRIHAVGRDVTQERVLARDRERIWTLSPVLKVVATLEGVIHTVNPSWTNVLGWTAEETIGHNVLEFVAPEDRDAGIAGMEELAAGATVIEYQNVLATKDGGRKRISWTTVPEDGTLYGFGRDITAETESATALAETEAALRQSQKMEAVGQLTGGIAHDFNNLLQGITGSLELIQRRVAQGRTSELDRFVGGATTAANRAAALTHRLLAFSRRQPLDPKPVRANALIASMEDLLRRTLGEMVQLELVLSAGLWVTRCDPNQLENAILNLVINARDAMPQGGQLTVETCNAHLDSAYAASQRGVTPGQYVCVSVTDTGSGMDADTIAKAFEPFFTTKPIGQGTGLGLSMIYGFAQQSEGYAKIYSEVGKGTTFKLYLPRFRGAAEADEAIPAIGEAHVTDASEVVLVIEDEPVVRGLIVEELTELGYRPIEAVDGPMGLEILQSERRIDLLITDMGLPGLNGRQVADAARVARPDLKVLFMTGYAENAALASGFLEPGMAMITKPFAMEALATRIRRILEGEEG